MKYKEELISLSEYATLHNLSPRTIRQKATAGGFVTAKKIGRNWIIDKNEPYIDKRIKSGKYINARKKNSPAN
jgi:hypothetical protein